MSLSLTGGAAPAQTFVEKGAEEQSAIIARDFVPAMMDPILGDYARNVPDARCALNPAPAAPRQCEKRPGILLRARGCDVRRRRSSVCRSEREGPAGGHDRVQGPGPEPV